MRLDFIGGIAEQEVLRRALPGVALHGSALLFDIPMTMADINHRIRRFGFETGSRFPGLSVRIRRFQKQRRTPHAALQWYKNTPKMLKKERIYPFYDELHTDHCNQLFVRAWNKLTEDEKTLLRRVLDPRGGGSFLADRYNLTLVCGRQEYLRERLSQAELVAVLRHFSLRVTEARPWPLYRLPEVTSHLMESYFTSAQGRSRMAEAGATLIRDQLRQESFLRRAFPPG